MKKIYGSIAIKSIIIILGIIGVMATAGTGGFMGDGKMFMYFTLQSNLWVIGIMTVFLILNLVQLKKPDLKIPHVLYVIKYMLTVSITLTFLVFAIFLVPFIGLKYAFSLSSLPLHYIGPVLTILDLIFCDYAMHTKKWYCLLATIPPYYYVGFVLFCYFTGRTFDAAGGKFPYYFMNFEQLGWFRIDRNGIGFVWWILIMTGIVVGTGYLYLIWMKKRKNKVETTQSKGV